MVDVDTAFQSAAELTQRIRARELSAVAVTQVVLDRIDAKLRLTPSSPSAETRPYKRRNVRMKP